MGKRTRTALAAAVAGSVSAVGVLAVVHHRPATPSSVPVRAGALHPGALNPNVTQANIATTICVRGWTATIRPAVSYTSALKRRELQAEHMPGTPGDYEEDHLVSLELGGNPTNPTNLWPEPWETRGAKLARPGTGAESKDREENTLRSDVCAGRRTLADAQRQIVKDWGPSA